MKHYFNSLLSVVLEERKNSYKSNRTAVWERQISKRTERYFEGIYIEDIDDGRLYRFFSYLRVKDNGELYSDKYIKAVYSIVKAVFRRAVVKGYIYINPMDYDFKRPKGNIPQPRERLISDENLKLIVKVSESNPLYETITKLLMLTGMRIGELLGLYWTDIDFDNSIIHIRREAAIIYKESINGELYREGIGLFVPKTQSSNRDLPVSEECLDVLRRWLTFRDMPENAEWKLNIEKRSNQNLVFSNRAGNIIDYSILRQGFVKFCAENGINENITFHKFRHNYATNLLSAGVDIAVVSRMLGHNNIETTANIYAKVETEPMKAAVKLHTKYLKKHSIIE